MIEDDEFFEADDLGLGFGFKPGGLPPLPQTPRRSPDGKSAVDQNTTTLYESLPNSPIKSPVEAQESCVNQEEAVKDIISKLTSWKISSFLEKFTSLSLPKKSKVDDNIAGGSQHSSCKKCKKKTTVKKGRRRRNSDSALEDNRVENKECLRRTKSVKGLFGFSK